MMKRLAATLVLLAATPAVAQEEPRFCPNRPSLGSSACTTDPGRVQMEASAFDWERDDTADERSDTIVAGDFLARFGVAPSTEVQVGWTAYGHARVRDKATGRISTESGTGDVLLAVRQNLRNADGDGFSFGIQPQVILPVGGEAIGAGDWGAGVLVPVSYDLSDALNLQFTGEADAAVDEDRDGRHLAYSGIVGLGYQLSKAVTLVGEVQVERDNDPADHQTRALAAGSIAWQPRSGLQLDLLAVAGLNHDAPDLRIVTGGAILF